MSNLAIRGHATRGKKVIEILEMLGGKNYTKLIGTEPLWGYYINSKGEIDFKHSSNFDDAMPFTLEEFLEKFPYKVGDKVKIKETGKDVTIEGMSWRNDCEVVYETCYNNDCVAFYSAIELQPYKEAPTYLNRKANEQAEEIKKILEPAKDIMEGVYAYNEINCYHQDFGDKVRIRLGNDFEIKVEDKITYIVKKQSQYPKTYEECVQILGERASIRNNIGYKGDLLVALQRLLVCRNAYWKIAGEQMGLDKPWEPDCSDDCIKYIITVAENKIYTDVSYIFNYILVFPTEEMRNVFCENFKKNIEECKELL